MRKTPAKQELRRPEPVVGMAPSGGLLQILWIGRRSLSRLRKRSKNRLLTRAAQNRVYVFAVTYCRTLFSASCQCVDNRAVPELSNWAPRRMAK
jgi:hypothetical protein